MSEAPQPNTTEARTPDGTILDQGKQVESKTTTTPSTTTTPTPSTSSDMPSDSSTTPQPDGKTSLLNESDEKAPAPVGAPESYEPFTAPTGLKLDDAALAKATPIFKELGLTQAQAQRLVEFQASLTKDHVDAPIRAYDALRAEWQSAVRTDAEIGSKLPEVKETIGRAFDALGDAKLTKEFKSVMDLTGAGDHPAFVKAFYKMAQLVVEPRHVAGKGPAPQGQNPSGTTARKSAASAMFPNLPSAS